MDNPGAEDQGDSTGSHPPLLLPSPPSPNVRVSEVRRTSRISKSELSYVQSAVDEWNESIESLSEVKLARRKKNFRSILTFTISLWKFKGASRGAWNYCRHVSDYFELINTQLLFPVFPERCGRLTHLSAQIWILTFGLMEISGDLVPEKDFDSLNKALGRLISEGDLTESAIKEFTSQLYTSTSTAMDTLKDSSDKLEARFISSNSHQRQSVLRPDISVKELLLTGSRLEDDGLFRTIRLYMRTSGKRKWFRFVAFSIANSLKVITEGLEKVATSLKIMRKRVMVLRKYLEGTNFCCGTTIEDSTTKMSTALDSMLENRNGLFSESLLRVRITIRKSRAVIYSLRLHGRKIGLQVLEVQAMTQLCCKYIMEGLRIPLKINGDRVGRKLKDGPVLDEEEDDEESDSGFKPNDFFKTSYPDLLRKVPVIIHQNELSLHKDTGEGTPTPPSWVSTTNLNSKH